MEIISIIGAWLICIIASERSAEAITASEFFSPMRQFIARTALIDQKWVTWPPVRYKLLASIFKWLSDLVSCGWCTSLWTSLLFSLFLPGRYLLFDASDNLFVKAIALWGFANLYHSVFRLLHNGRVMAIDVNLRLIDDSGGIDGELGERTSQENAIRVEPPTV
jgi:hypothetical protein